MVSKEDKEMIIKQLESEISNKDGKHIADIIHGLSDDIIINFDQTEFSHIIDICRGIDVEDALFNYLIKRGQIFWNESLSGCNEPNATLLCRFYLSLALSLFSDCNTVDISMFDAFACCKLAEMGIDRKENFELAMKLFIEVRKAIPKTDERYFPALANESNVRERLTDMNVNREENFKEMVLLYEAQTLCAKDDQYHNIALARECMARFHLAEMYIEPEDNYNVILQRYESLKADIPEDSLSYGGLLMKEADARYGLANANINVIENLKKVAALQLTGRITITNAMNNYKNARRPTPDLSIDCALSMLLECDARQALAEMGIDSKNNLEAAIKLSQDAGNLVSDKSVYAARALQNEGAAVFKLGEIESNNKERFDSALQLFEKANSLLLNPSEDYAVVLMNESGVKFKLAYSGVDSKKNYESMIALNVTARNMLPDTSLPYAMTLMNESLARASLANMDIDARTNLLDALSLCNTAQTHLSKGTLDYIRTLMDEGALRCSLAEMGVDSDSNIETAKKLYVDSIDMLEKLGDAWTYSIALIRLNSLLRSIYLKTGKETDFAAWKAHIDTIENKVNSQSLMRNDLLMAKVHEMRASILETGDNVNIELAAREYGEAYDLSGDEFYNFMDQFCRARLDLKSFCSLITEWKTTTKTGIFLDYYNYAAFECYVENAMIKNIARQKNLDAAIKTLEDLFKTSHISVINEADAYIHLIKAVKLCTEQNACNVSVSEVQDHIQKAHDIFENLNNTQACNLCEELYTACESNSSIEYWENVANMMRFNKHLTSNVYKLVSVYADKKRSEITRIEIGKSRDIVKKLDEIGNRVAQIQDQISSVFNNIRSEIKETPEVTEKEIREIKMAVYGIEDSIKNFAELAKKMNDANMDAIDTKGVMTLSAEIPKIIGTGEKEILEPLKDGLLKNMEVINAEVEASNETPEKKEAIRHGLFGLRDIEQTLKDNYNNSAIGKVINNQLLPLGGAVAEHLTVGIIAEMLLEILTPFISTAVVGIPISPTAMKTVIEAVKAMAARHAI